MSTTFAIIYKEEEFPIAHRWFNGEEAEIRWLNALGELLPDDTKVIPTNNTAQGIHTIGDLKDKIKKGE